MQKDFEKIVKATFRNFGREKTTEQLDYQDAMQQCYLDNFVAGKVPDMRTIKHEIKCNMRDLFRRTANFNLSDNEKLKDEIALPTGEVVMAIKAIKKTLTKKEFDAVSLYAQGHTLEAIGKTLELTEEDGTCAYKVAAHRLLRRAEKKIESLKVSYLYESKYVAYQGKKGRPQVTYPETWEDNGNAIKRLYHCLDQTRQRVARLLKANYKGDMCPTVPPAFEVKTEGLTYADQWTTHSRMVHEHLYQHSATLRCRNKELIQIENNEAIIKKQILKDSTILEDKKIKVHPRFDF